MRLRALHGKTMRPRRPLCGELGPFLVIELVIVHQALGYQGTTGWHSQAELGFLLVDDRSDDLGRFLGVHIGHLLNANGEDTVIAP